MTSAVANTVAALAEEERDILLWRMEQFESLGFCEDEALLLAGSAADLGHARSLHRGGCPTELALAILL